MDLNELFFFPEWSSLISKKPKFQLLHTALPAFTSCQALFLRLSVTCVLAVLLAKHSCVTRILRALYIYKSKDTVSKGCLGLGVTLEAVDLSSGLTRSATSYLTPDAADSLSNRTLARSWFKDDLLFVARILR